MYNPKLPNVDSPLKLGGIALWQHTIFTEALERTLCLIKSSRSSVFLKIHHYEKKRRRNLVLNLLSKKIAYTPHQRVKTGFYVRKRMVWIGVPDFWAWDKDGLPAKTECIECIKLLMYHDVQSELILLDNVLRWRVGPICADMKKQGNNLEAEKLSTYVSMFASILQSLNMSYGFVSLSDT